MTTLFATTYVLSFWSLWIAMILGGLLYWLPTIIALARRSPSWLAIGLLNFFLGWSLIGWLGALVWALTGRGYRKTSFG